MTSMLIFYNNVSVFSYFDVKPILLNEAQPSINMKFKHKRAKDHGMILAL